MAVGDTYTHVQRITRRAGTVSFRPASGTKILITCVLAMDTAGEGAGDTEVQLVSGANSEHLILFPGGALDEDANQMPRSSPLSTEKLIITNGQYLRMEKSRTDGVAWMYLAGIIVEES